LEYPRSDHVVRHALGLSFGGEQLGPGLAGFVLGMLVLSVMKRIEGLFSRQQRASLTLMTTEDGFSESNLRSTLEPEGENQFLVGYLFEFTASRCGGV
jgi:hypothetical protein